MTDRRNCKTYVIDTSVLLSDPSALRNFDEHNVVLPLVVLKELEMKRSHPTLGFNARKVLRYLEELRTVPGADLREGVTVNQDGGTVRIEINHSDTSQLPDVIKSERSADTRILNVADSLRRDGNNVIVVSKDLPMRLLAHGALGIPAEEYRREQVRDSGRYTGMASVDVSQEELDMLYENRHLLVDDTDLAANTGVIVTSPTGSALGTMENPKEIRLLRGRTEAFGVIGRSAEQRIALAHLTNPEIGIVSLGGRAGTGKSVLALAAALELVVERNDMQHIIVFRPVMAVGGQELGFLPGSESEKMDPWAAAVFDALRAVTTDEVIREVQARGILQILPLTHIRGRTFTNTVVIVDEAQSLEMSSILSTVSRVGENSRVFLLHDVAQRDNLRVGRYDGIAAVVERLKGEPLFAHVTLTRSERSPIAELASRMLDVDGNS